MARSFCALLSATLWEGARQVSHPPCQVLHCRCVTGPRHVGPTFPGATKHTNTPVTGLRLLAMPPPLESVMSVPRPAVNHRPMVPLNASGTIGAHASAFHA